MNLYDRHLLREWLGMLGIVLGATVGLLLVQVLYDDFRTLRDLGANLSVMGRYLVVTVPSFLAIVLPVALLVSLMYTLGKLHRANEFTALRAAGIGLGRITAPVWVVGVLACGLSWWLNTRVVPWSVEQSQALRESLQFEKDANRLAEDRVGAVYSVGFDNPEERRMWFFNRYSRYANRGYGVSVSRLDERRQEAARIVAAQAWPAGGGGWMFQDGRELTFDPATGEQLASVPFTLRTEAEFREDPKLMLLIDRRPKDLSLPQLERLIEYFEVQQSPKGTPYAVRFFTLIADTLAPLIVIAIAIPFAVTGVRVNPAVGVSKSLGLFALYYVLTNLASALATKHLLDPLQAAWLPNAGMALIAGWLFLRLR